MTPAALFAEIDISRTTAWLILAGSVASALVAIATAWRKVFRPLASFAATLDSYFPVMVAIAKHYADEKGGEALTNELAGLTANQQSIADNQKLIADRLDTLHTKLDSLHDYSHAMRHDIIGDVAQLGLVIGTTGTLVDALLTVGRELRAVRGQLTPSTGDTPPTPDNG